MKKTLTIIFLIVLLFSCDKKEEALLTSVDVTPEEEGIILPEELANTDYNILFVGNSLTYTNGLPDLVKKEALKHEIKIGTKMIASPNYAIVDHWAKGEVQKYIKSKAFNYVVIQQGPSSQQEGRDMLIEGGKEYSDLCNLYETKLCYFMVWPSQAYYHTFDGVIKNHQDAATINNAILCPVGEVWKTYFDETGDYSYYGPDGFHPSLLGSQIAAKVIVETLFL